MTVALGPGDTVGRYRVEAVLGKGGMAIVYRVHHLELGTDHALKLLVHTGDGLRDRLLQEGRMMARLRHPNIVSVSDVVRHDGFVGLVMDLVDGVSLSMLAYNYSMRGEKLDQLAHDLFDGLETAHRLGVVHRDLKPDNILMGFEGEHVVARIADFGLAKALTDELRVGKATQQGLMMGTPQYMAPEQFFDAASVDARADIYALGAILYEVVGRRRLFSGLDLAGALTASVSGDWKRLEEVPEGCPDHWRGVIHTCLATKPDGRPADVAALRALWGPRPARRPAWSEADRAYLLRVREKLAASAPPPQLPAASAPEASPSVPQPRPAADAGNRPPLPSAPPRPSRWRALVVAGAVLAIAATVAWLAVAGLSLAWVGWELTDPAATNPSTAP